MTDTISSLILSTESGDRSAADALFAALYAELHRLAKSQLARSGPRVTLSATTLIHEAYLNIAGRGAANFPDEALQRRVRPLGRSPRGRLGRVRDSPPVVVCFPARKRVKADAVSAGVPVNRRSTLADV
jgi:hypothetical protein